MKNNLLKLVSVLLCVVLCAVLLTACGEQAAPAATDPAEVTGETFDAGKVSALVPNGWKAFPQHDVFSDDAKAMLPDVINIIKGGSSDTDMFTKPYIRFDFGDAEKTLYFTDKDFYDDVADLEPITTGEHTWNGFSCTSLGYKMIILCCEDGDLQYQATIYTEQSNGKISLDDADVQAILASVAPSAAS